METEKRFQTLCDLTTELVGLPLGSLACKSRKHKYQVPRAVVSVLARKEENIHQNVIAKVLNRDRSNIYHYEKMHPSNYRTYVKYRNVYIKVIKAYESIKNENKSFSTQKEFDNFLHENKIYSSNNFQSILLLKVGSFHVNLKLSYKDFYNVIEIIKFALKDYDYEYKVI